VLAEALVLERPRELSPKSFPLPALGDDDGLLRVEACGMCGTDHELFTGAIAPGFAFVPGHEIVGVVESVGPAAAARWGVAAGDRVAVECFQSCGRCAPCTAGLYRRCSRHGLGDMYGLIDVRRAPALWGGYATHLYLAPDALVLPLPADLEPAVAAAFNPVGAGIRWGATLPGTAAGDVVAVVGCGVRGLAAAAAAKDAGAAFVMVTGAGPRDQRRLELARDFGVDLAVDVTTDDPVRRLRQEVGNGADVVVDVTARAPDAFGQAVAVAAVGGRVVVAGTRGAGSGAPGFDPDVVVHKELTIYGALGVDAVAYRAAIDLIASGRHPFADLPRAVAGFDGAADLLATMAGEAGEPPIHAVIVPGGPSGA
jgi:alcohol dehydrogenase